ncbi:MAG TPA: acetylornithine transaminase [Candidatus Nanoarchaeia archaeon]|nr:acetylornithine transaminase [Candidatus Nanoarchaeia archaeon]
MGIKELEHQYIMHTYNRFDVVITKGKGCYVFDDKGKKYLDFITGIGCVPLGHANPAVSKAMAKQAASLMQVSNLYYTKPQVELAQKLSKISGLQKCFFCNSGTEANEAAIKLAKKISKKKKFIAFEHSFHGRTTGSLAATSKIKYKEPFMPLAPLVTFVKYNDISSLEQAISKETAAVIIEPIQGEAGIIIPDKGYLKQVEKVCKKHKILLIVDEVQSGNGKTGKFFAYQLENVKPDIVTTAKGLANGFPIGVCIARKGLDFKPGEHASTFGGNSLACAAAIATIDEIMKLMQNAQKMGNYLMQQLKNIKKPIIKKVKGKGLMIGIELKKDVAKNITLKCLKKGLLVNNVADDILRCLPPLTITKKEADTAVKILKEVL